MNDHLLKEKPMETLKKCVENHLALILGDIDQKKQTRRALIERVVSDVNQNDIGASAFNGSTLSQCQAGARLLAAMQLRLPRHQELYDRFLSLNIADSPIGRAVREIRENTPA